MKRYCLSRRQKKRPLRGLFPSLFLAFAPSPGPLRRGPEGPTCSGLSACGTESLRLGCFCVVEALRADRYMPCGPQAKGVPPGPPLCLAPGCGRGRPRTAFQAEFYDWPQPGPSGVWLLPSPAFKRGLPIRFGGVASCPMAGQTLK